MKDSRYEAAMSRRSLLTRLAAAGASYVGLTAFTRSTGASSTGSGVGRQL